MTASKLGKFAVIGLSAAVIAGCSTTSTDTDTSAATEEAAAGEVTEAASSDADSSSTSGAGQDAAITSVIVEAEEEAATALESLAGVATVFYFDFDKSIVRPESREALAKHAAYLVATPDARVVLEGHADERGTREYNMALGERRAKAISRYLTIQGVAASQIETVSFGEETPMAFSHNKAAWQLNRRVEVRYE